MAMSIEIQINGEPREVPESLSVSELLVLLELAHKRLAVEINRDIVPRSQHADHRLQPGDKVELIQAMGGG